MALVVKIGADLTGYQAAMKQFKKEMNQATADIKAVGTGVQNIGKAMTVAFTAPLVALAGESVKTGMDFEKAMSNVAAISGATGDDLEALEQKAREMGKSTTKSSTEAADAMGYMALAGYDVEDMLTAIEPMLKLGGCWQYGDGQSLRPCHRQLVRTGAWGRRFRPLSGQHGHNQHQGKHKAGRTNGSVHCRGWIIEESKCTVGRILRTPLGVMANRGTKGSEAGNALSAVIQNLTNPLGQAKKALSELNISAFESDGSFKGLENLLMEVKEKTEGLTEEQKNQYIGMIAGKSHVSDINKLLAGLGDEYFDLKDSITQSDGALEKMAETITDNSKGGIEGLKSAFEELQLVLFDKLKPAFDAVIGFVKEIIDWFNNLSPAAQGVIITIAGIVAAIGSLLVVVVGAIIAFAQISAILGPLGITFMGLVAPILGVVLAVAAIVAIFVLFGDEIKAFYDTYFKPIIDQIVGMLVDTFKPVFEQVFNQVSTIVSEAFQTIKRLWDEVLQPIFNIIKTYIQDVLLPVWQVVFSTIDEVVSGVFKNIAEVWEKSLKPIFNGIIDFISGVFSGNWSKAWDGIVDIFKGIFGGIATIAKIPINALWVPGFGGMGFNIPNIPRLKVGMDYVPSDYFPAYLDEGERVMTKEENKRYSALGGLAGMERDANQTNQNGGGDTQTVYNYSGMFDGAVINWHGKEDIMKTMEQIAFVTQTRTAGGLV